MIADIAHSITHAIVSLDVRARGRLAYVRATHPPHVATDDLAPWVEAALLAKGMGHVDVAWIPDPGPARVLSASTAERCRW
jgi:hypothetical protein